VGGDKFTFSDFEFYSPNICLKTTFTSYEDGDEDEKFSIDLVKRVYINEENRLMFEIEVGRQITC